MIVYAVIDQRQDYLNIIRGLYKNSLLKKSYTIVALICEACKIKASQFFI